MHIPPSASGIERNNWRSNTPFCGPYTLADVSSPESDSMHPSMSIYSSACRLHQKSSDCTTLLAGFCIRMLAESWSVVRGVHMPLCLIPGGASRSVCLHFHFLFPKVYYSIIWNSKVFSGIGRGRYGRGILGLCKALCRANEEFMGPQAMCVCSGQSKACVVSQ